MYCVYQKKHNGNQKNVISIIKFPENFIITVSDVIRDIYKLEYTMLENTTLDDLKNSKNMHINGCYLLNNANKLMLVNKIETIQKGRIYNSTIVEIVKEYTWELLPFEIPVSTETVVETVEESVEEIMEESVEETMEESVEETMEEPIVHESVPEPVVHESVPEPIVHESIAQTDDLKWVNNEIFLEHPLKKRFLFEPYNPLQQSAEEIQFDFDSFLSNNTTKPSFNDDINVESFLPTTQKKPETTFLFKLPYEMDNIYLCNDIQFDIDDIITELSNSTQIDSSFDKIWDEICKKH